MKTSYLKRTFAFACFALMTQVIPAQQYLFVDNFNGDSSYPPDYPDWAVVNNSSPLGYIDWFLGSPATFSALTGADSSYIAANYNSVDSVGTISNWLLTPELQLANGNVFRFYTRNPSHDFADRLQVYLSTAGNGTDVGNTATSVGTFSTLLADINPSLTLTGYPATWTAYSMTLTGISSATATGRFGFRYYVANGGSSGSNSNYVGIDSVTYYQPAQIVTGIKTIVNNTSLSVYPNPFKNELTISGTSTGKAEIYDLLGKQVMAVDLENGHSVNTASLEKGMYLMRILNDKDEVLKVQKITKE